MAKDAPTEAKDALLAFKNAIVKASKERVQIKDGDLLCIPNKGGLHAREIIENNDPQKGRIRWLLKTYNFRDTEILNKFSDYYYHIIIRILQGEDYFYHCPGEGQSPRHVAS